MSSLLGIVATRSILARTGEPAAPLDDAFIHLQYAKRLAEGHFFSYVPGEGYTTGATSLLWPLILAVFYKLGFRELSLIHVAWLLGTLAHAALIIETYRLAERLAGRGAAAGAGAMSALFGAFAWFAWSGMETVPFAWILTRTARVGAAYCEPPEDGAAPRSGELIALGLIAPLVRPEGAIASLIAATALLVRGRGLRRLLALTPLAGPLVIPLLHRALAGHATSATAQVKWLIGNPYCDRAELIAAIGANVRLLFTNLLDGGDWTAIFLPEHFAIALALGALALPIAALRRRAPWHALFVAMVALGALIPCTYLSLLWNRVRYIWPFAAAWFVLLACFARELGDLIRRARPRATFAAPLIAGLFAGDLAGRLGWTLRDLAQSAAAVHGQQVKIARWAAEHLPPDARVGVNDTGAIAYLSGRKTFDIVGLTTEGEARYWAAGPGSRFEHYEKLPKDRLPTHFIVYPEWMRLDPVLGRQLWSETVTEQAILGGPTMIAYEARWDLLGTGALPARPPEGLALVDEVDVADLESEAAHGYELGDASDQTNGTAWGELHSTYRGTRGDTFADGGRLDRSRDRFVAHLPENHGARLVMRVGASRPVTLAIWAGAAQVAIVRLPGSAAEDIEVEAPLVDASAETPITVAAMAWDSPHPTGAPPSFHAFHYWFYARKP